MADYSNTQAREMVPNSNQDWGTAWYDLDAIATPANPVANTRRLFVDSADSKLKVRTSSGSSVSLEEQGGGADAFPVNSVFLAVVATNPATLLGYGTWVQIAQGKFIVGQNGADVDFDVAEETGGVKTHTHTTHVVTQPNDHLDVLNHVHRENRNSATTGGLDGWGAGDTSTNTPLLTGYSTANPTTGGVAAQVHTGAAVDAHNSPSHLPPYLVLYCWKRTA